MVGSALGLPKSVQLVENLEFSNAAMKARTSIKMHFSSANIISTFDQAAVRVASRPPTLLQSPSPIPINGWPRIDREEVVDEATA